MLLWLAFLLGAASFSYIGVQPPVLGFPFPNLQGEWIVRPTFGRVTSFYLGRLAGCLMLSLLFTTLGLFFQSQLLMRLIVSLAMVLALFMFLFLAVRSSPEIILARWTDPSRLNTTTLILGWLSCFTMVSPLFIACLFSMLEPAYSRNLFFFTNFFLGNAVCSLPFLLNMQWVKTQYYQWVLKIILFFCALCVLILSTIFFIKS